MTKGYKNPTRIHRRHHRHAFLALRVTAGICLTIAAVVAVAILSRSKPQPAASSGEPDAVLSSDFAAALPPREVYKYSVIKGGTYSASELSDAITRDPIVADHYRSIDIANVRAETVNTDRLAYMSYRRGDQIYWTKHKIQLRQGETILTDGVTQVRSRCGNCISLDPMQPTAEDEPQTVEFEALSSDPAVVATLPSRPYMFTPPPALLLPPPFGTVPFESAGPTPAGLVATNLSDVGPDNVLEPGIPDGARDLSGPVFAPESPDVPFPVPPANLPPGLPGRENPPGTFPDSDNAPGPGELPPLVNTPPFESPIDLPPDFNPDEEITEDHVTPVPVPEPGTLLLIGGGGIGLMFRRLRSRKGSRPQVTSERR
jgi:hypothetical protein